jgi:hypothetical protein
MRDMAEPITFKNLLLLASVALAISAGLPSRAHAQAADLPSDVKDLVSRRSGCLALNRRAFESEGRAQLDGVISEMRSLKCGEITDDEKALQEKYAGNSEVLEALKTAWVKVVKQLPVRKPDPLDTNP